MITRDDIKKVLIKYSEEIKNNTSYSFLDAISLGNMIREGNYGKIADELYEKVFEELIKSAKLEAELEICLTIIEHSNFKMATAKIKEDKNA
nr:MAG TPA: hypothetical protein [Caudoviricetes sp.]